MKNNYEILGLKRGADQKEIQNAFRRLALKYHSDRGGDEKQFMKIKQAYDELRKGQVRQGGSSSYGDDDADSIQRNMTIAREIIEHMQEAQTWAAQLVKSAQTGTRLFGSTSLGEVELERKANGVLAIRGNVMAGSLSYAGPVTVRGGIMSPTWGAEPTRLTAETGDFEVTDALANRYRIESGASIVATHGNITAGDIFGKKRRINDADGKVGVYTIKEYRTRLDAPDGAIRIHNAMGAVDLRARAIEINNAQDDVRIAARDIVVRGSAMTHDVHIHLLENGTLRFLESHSILSLSDDVRITLENGTKFSLRELKVKKIRNIPGAPAGASDDATLVGDGYVITYSMLDALDSGPSTLRRFMRRRR